MDNAGTQLFQVHFIRMSRPHQPCQPPIDVAAAPILKFISICSLVPSSFLFTSTDLETHPTSPLSD